MSHSDDGTGGSNYEYVMARVRARRASLYDSDDYRKLVRMQPSEIARYMEESEYEDAMNALGSRHSGVDLIEYALNENLANHFEDLLRFAEGKLYRDISRYLRKFDAWNVKTIIRGVYADAGPDEVRNDLILAGELDDDRMDRLLTADSIEAVIEELSDTMFGEPLEDAYPDYEESGVLVPLENAVDRTFYERLLSGLPENPEHDSPTGLYVEFLTAEIDFRNLRNALRLARSGADIDPAAYYIDGGELFTETQLNQIATDTDRIVQVVRESAYADDLDEALDTLVDASGLIEFERALDAALMEYADTLSNRYPLSVCPVLSYILAKEREVDNIRAIARGREAGLSQDQIETELVIL